MPNRTSVSVFSVNAFSYAVRASCSAFCAAKLSRCRSCSVSISCVFTWCRNCVHSSNTCVRSPSNRRILSCNDRNAFSTALLLDAGLEVEELYDRFMSKSPPPLVTPNMAAPAADDDDDDEDDGNPPSPMESPNAFVSTP